MLCKDWDDLDKNGQKGDWYFHHDDTYITIRWGDDTFDVVTIPIKLMKESNAWRWDGNKDAPTIEPSIRLLGGDGQPDRWHGWLRNGQLITA